MPDKLFVDTNVVVYLYSNDEPEKRDAARALFRESVPFKAASLSIDQD